MKRCTAFLLLVSLLVFSLAGCGEKKPSEAPTATPSEEATPELTATPTPTPTEAPVVNPLDSMTLKDRYKDVFKVGVALPNSVISNASQMEVVKEQFNSMTFENEMKPEALLDREATQKGYPDTKTEPILKFGGIERGLRFAEENGLGVRGHTLCWYSQTPAWFFTVDYQPNSALCSKEVMIARLESYIKQVMTYCQTNHPGLIYAWDVVNEAVDPGTGDANGIRKGKNLWYETIGPEFIQYAFRFARKYSDGTADLYYNDYGCANKRTIIVKVLAPILAEGNIDGIGMQSHLSTGDNIQNTIYKTAKYFASEGYKVQITELDIGVKTLNEDTELIQAMKYKLLFQFMEQAKLNGEIDIDSVTVWGLYDTISWRSKEHPLMYQTFKLNRKMAWYGAMQDPEIKAFEW